MQEKSPCCALSLALLRLSPDESLRRSCVPNLAAKAKGDKRLHLADEVEALRDLAQLSLRRPVDRGFVVNATLQRDIWERVLKRVLKASAHLSSWLAQR